MRRSEALTEIAAGEDVGAFRGKDEEHLDCPATDASYSDKSLFEGEKGQVDDGRSHGGVERSEKRSPGSLIRRARRPTSMSSSSFMAHNFLASSRPSANRSANSTTYSTFLPLNPAPRNAAVRSGKSST